MLSFIEVVRGCDGRCRGAGFRGKQESLSLPVVV